MAEERGGVSQVPEAEVYKKFTWRVAAQKFVRLPVARITGVA